MKALPADAQIPCELHSAPRRHRLARFELLMALRRGSGQPVAMCFDCAEAIKSRLKQPLRRLAS